MVHRGVEATYQQPYNARYEAIATNRAERRRNASLSPRQQRLARKANRSLVAQLREAQMLQSIHLLALRIVSDAMGHPFAGQVDKSCVDLANLAAQRLKQST